MNQANLATELYFAFRYNLSQAELIKKLPENEPRLLRDLFKSKPAILRKKISDVYWVLARDTWLARLCLAGRRLTFRQEAITGKSLASELGISRATFYRKYPSGLKRILRVERQLSLAESEELMELNETERQDAN